MLIILNGSKDILDQANQIFNQIEKDIHLFLDIFEYLFLRAGSITLLPTKDKVIMLNTVLNINKKADQIDELLSRMRVEIDDNA